MARLKKEHFDVILLDMNFRRGHTEGSEGIGWLEKIKEEDPEVVVILMTAFGDVDLAVKGIKAGDFDFIMKPWQNAKLHASIFSALKLKESRQEKEKYRNVAATLESDDNLPFGQIIGESAVMQKLKETIRIIAPTDASVLILGENGCGKEMVARAMLRELQNTLQRAVIMSEDKQLRFDQLGTNPSGSAQAPTLNIEENEKLLISKALLSNRGNVSQASSDLGIERNALCRGMKKYGI